MADAGLELKNGLRTGTLTHGVFGGPHGSIGLHVGALHIGMSAFILIEASIVEYKLTVSHEI